MGVVSNNWCYSVLPSIVVHVQTLLLTDVQTPFFWTPLVPFKSSLCIVILWLLCLVFDESNTNNIGRFGCDSGQALSASVGVEIRLRLSEM